ncbi:bifunctional 3'-5' exonuclease/DNA polymerase, partial [Streptomyces sp. WAC06614]
MGGGRLALVSEFAARWLLAEEGDGRWQAGPVGGDAAVHGVAEPATAVAAAPPGTRWVWRSTAAVYPRLLAAGTRVERCYDIEDAELLLLGHEGRSGEPRSAAAAWARLRGEPVPPDPPLRAAEPGTQSSL